MFERDLFVAIVAFGLGSFLIHAIIIGRPACYEFWLVKRIEARFGRSAATNTVAIVGAVLILLGIYVLMFPSKTHRSQKNRLFSIGFDSGISSDSEWLQESTQ